MVKLAASNLTEEDTSNEARKLKKSMAELRNELPDQLQTQKEKFEDLIRRADEMNFTEEEKKSLYQAGVDCGEL